MQRHRLIVTPDNKLESFKQTLSEKYPSQITEINRDEKEKIRSAILSIKFPYSVKDIQVYLNEEAANLLANSSDSVLKEWGDKFKQVYTDPSYNKFIEPESGLIVAKRGGIHAQIGGIGSGGLFLGNGVWNISSNSWIPSPGSYDNKGGVCIGNFLNDVLYNSQYFYNFPRLNPPNLSTSPFKLLSPFHIAVLLDDVPLMEDLISKGIRADDDLNDWHLTPIELAVMHERSNAINFLFKNNAIKNIDKAIKLTIEKASFPFIEKLISCVSLTQEAIEAARTRDNNLVLYSYLEARRKNDAHRIIENEGVFKALQFFLSQKVIPILSIIDLICDHPEIVINPLQNDPDDNTIFHWAITTGELKKIEALLEGFYQAKLRKPGLSESVDVKKQNKQGKTVLDMALSQTNCEISSAILSHCHRNPIFTDSQKTQIVTAKIDLAGITNQQNDKMQNILCSLHQRVDMTEEVAANTLFNQIEMEKEQILLKNQIMEMAEEQSIMKQKLLQMEQMLMLLCQHVNNMVPIPNNEVVREQPMLQQANNQNRLFAMLQNINEPIRVEMQRRNVFGGQ